MLGAVVQRAAAPGLPRDLVIAGAVVLAGAATAVTLPVNADYPLEAVLIGLTAGAFALALDLAVWAIAPLLIVEFSIKYYAFGDTASAAAAAASTTAPANTTGITLRLVVVILATLMSLAILLRIGPRIVATRAGLQVLLPAVALIVIAVTFDLPREPQDATTKYLRYQLTQLGAMVLIACLVRRPRDLQIVLGVGLTLMVVSAGLAVWQFQDPFTAPFAGPAITGGLGQTDQSRASDSTLRAVGLSGSPIQLAGAMGVAVPFLLGLLACGGIKRNWMRWALCAAALLLGMATYLTFTRAAMLAIAGGLAVIALFLPLDRRVAIWSALGGAGLLFVLLEGSGLIGDRYYQGASQDNSAASHLALFEVGTAIALDNPLMGIGHSQFQDVSTGYSAVVSADAHTANGGTTLGTDPPHDDFLLVWISWGLPALASFVGIFLGAVANCVYAARHARHRLVRGAAIGLVGALTGYAVSSAFHNYLDSSLLLWLGAGLSIALVRLAATNGPPRRRLAHPGLWSSVELRRQLARERA